MAQKKTTKRTKQSETKADWFQLGEEGYEAKKKADAVTALRREKGVPRFYLKEGEEAVIVFLDETSKTDRDKKGFWILEHNLEIGGSWGNYVTCISNIDVCPVCQRGHNPTRVCYFTIIDTREFIRKDGKKVSNRKVLFPAKGVMADMVMEAIKKYGNLRGLAFRVKRYSKNSVNCGDFIEKLSKKVDLSKLPKDDRKPIDYLKILAPPTEEELDMLGYSAEIIRAEGSDDIEAEDGDLFV